MSTLNAIVNTFLSQASAKAIKVEPNSADISLVDEREIGVLISGSNGTSLGSGSVVIEAGDNGHGNLGGDIIISSGEGLQAGNINIWGKSNLTESNNNIQGAISLLTGVSDFPYPPSPNSTGMITIRTGSVSSDTLTGQIYIETGKPHNHTGSTSGSITIGSGGTSSIANAGHSGSVTIESGQGGTDESGDITIITGTTSTAISGDAYLRTGESISGASGGIGIATGSSVNSGKLVIKSGSGSNDSGLIQLTSGNATSGSSGAAFISTGSSTNDDSGKIYISTGIGGVNSGSLEMKTGVASAGDSGLVKIYTGNATSNTHSSGAISIYSGQGHTTSGNVSLESGITTGGQTGSATLRTGDATGGDSGDLTLGTGSSNVLSGSVLFGTGANLGASGSSGPSGEIFLFTGTTDGLTSGIITIATGDNAGGGSGGVVIKSGSGTSSSGDVSVYTSDVASGISGDVELYTGSSGSGSGSASIRTGSSFSQTTGQIDLSTGSSLGNNTGAINITTGNSTPVLTSGDTGNITLTTGNSPSGVSGDINIATGSGSTRGEVKVESNSIDATGYDRKLVQIASDGILKTLGINILGYGSIELNGIFKNKEIYRVPIFFKNNTTNTVDVDPVNYHGLSPYTPTIIETYQGDSVWDYATEAYKYSNMKVIISYRSGVPIVSIGQTSIGGGQLPEEIFRVEDSFIFVQSFNTIDTPLNFCGHLSGKLSFSDLQPIPPQYQFFFDYVVYITD